MDGMDEVTVHEAKTHLSLLLRQVEAGESFVIRRGRVPVAVLSPIRRATSPRRIWGSVAGDIPEDFDAELGDFGEYVG